MCGRVRPSVRPVVKTRVVRARGGGDGVVEVGGMSVIHGDPFTSEAPEKAAVGQCVSVYLV